MQTTLVVDFDKCTGCRICELWCSFIKTKTSNPTKSRVRVVKQVSEGINIPVMCQHCPEPPCAAACPVDAISRDEETGIVTLDMGLCIGCEQCVNDCPFGALRIDSSTEEVFMCDLCGGEPECVSVCPNEAIQYLEADREGLARKQQSMEELGGALRLASAKTASGER